MKYIDAEKLIALIDAKLEDLGLSGSVWVGRSVLQELKNDIITSLQQEHPEVDLEIEIDKEWKNCCPVDDGMGDESALLVIEQFHQITSHFYELGLNTRKEQPDVDLKEEIMKWQGYEAFPEGTNITPLPKAMDIVERTARHFYELGLNARNEK